MTIKKQIDRLVNKYSLAGDNKTLFRLELELLVAIAEKKQMLKDKKLFTTN